MIVALALCLAGSGDPISAPEYGFDATHIRWVLPTDFGTALERAKSEQRILLIKGVSFNIDEAGAKCATKGSW